MIVSLKFQVTALKQVYNMVEMHLYPYNPIPPEEIERARVEAELEEKPTLTEEEEAVKKIMRPLSSDPNEAMIQKIVQVYRKELPEFFEARREPPKGMLMAAVGPTSTPISQDLYVTIDQYYELGSPPLLSILTLNVEVGTP